jgi:hypothetical protein
MKKYLIILLLLVFAFPSISSAQKVGLKTNALYWATTTPNLGVEVAMGEKFTFNLEGGYNPWTFNEDLDVNQKMKHFIVSPEVRYWFCESFNGHFVGLMANCSQFNVSAMPIPNVFMTTGSKGAVVEGSKESRYQGWAAGAGLTYGYQLILGKHWNMEATLGLGYWYATYDQYENRKCGYFTQACQKHLFGPTKLGLSFIYLFK